MNQIHSINKFLEVLKNSKVWTGIITGKRYTQESIHKELNNLNLTYEYEVIIAKVINNMPEEWKNSYNSIETFIINNDYLLKLFKK